MRVLVALVLFILSGNLASAQRTITKQHLIWNRHYLTIELPKNLQIRQEVEERAYWFPWRQHQFLVRSHLVYKLKKAPWQFAAGFTYFVQTSPQMQDADETNQHTELRPQLEIATKQKLHQKLSLVHRYWSEFRFFEDASGKFPFGNLRFRYLLELQYSPISKLTLKAFNEVHLNAGKNIVYNVFDQNRTGAGIKYMIVPEFGIDAGYFYWFQQKSDGIGRFGRHILRITFSYAIKVKAKGTE